MKYKRYYLGGIVSILAIFAMIASNVTYYDYQDVVCAGECWTTFCMKNGVKNLYFYNKGELPLTFDNAGLIKGVQFYKKDGRFKSGYREIDFVTPYSKGVKYVFKIPAYSKTCYGMKIFKAPSATVKWTFLGLDPTLIAPAGNLTYTLNPGLLGNLSQNFRVNGSLIMAQINFSNNVTMQSGNFSWNISEYNISTNASWVYNLSNNGTTNFTVDAKINTTNSVLRVWLVENSTSRYNITSTSFVNTISLLVNESKLVNITIDLINISQTYINWTLNSSTADWAFNVTFNAT